MTERGVFAVDRGIWSHPVLQSREPFSRREAWLWLVSEAAWKARTVFVDGRRVSLNRGQLAHSIRFIADQWRWPKSNVARFLEVLKTDTMIGTETGHGRTIITICKYDEYQRVSLPDRDTDRDTDRDISGTRPGHDRDKLEDIKDIKDIELEKARRTSARATRLPQGWMPNFAGRCFAIDNGLTQAEADREFERFTNYWTAKAGKDAAKLDWDATWRNWVLKAADMRKPSNGTGAGAGTRTGTAAAFDDLISRLSDQEREGGPVIEHDPC